MAFTDTERLDWMLSHISAEFEKDKVGWYVTFWLGSSSPSGISGFYVAYGETQRDCIDAALAGNIKRID